MNRVLLILCLVLVAASFVLSGPAEARESRDEDYCTVGADACISQCGQYNASFFGVEIATPRALLEGIPSMLGWGHHQARLGTRILVWPTSTSMILVILPSL